MFRSAQRLSLFTKHILPRYQPLTKRTIPNMSHLFEDATPAEIKNAKVDFRPKAMKQSKGGR